MEFILQVPVDGAGGDLGGEAGGFGHEIHVGVADHGDAVHEAEPFNIVKSGAGLKACLAADDIVRFDLPEGEDFGFGFAVVPAHGLRKAFDASHGEQVFFLFLLVDHLDAAAVARLKIAFPGEDGQGPPDGIPGAVKPLRVFIFRGEIVAELVFSAGDILPDLKVDGFVLGFGHFFSPSMSVLHIASLASAVL